MRMVAGSDTPLSPLAPVPASAHPIELQPVRKGRQNMSNRIYRLLERHQRLDDHLRRAQARRFVDPYEISRLKKIKLAIKDRLARMLDRPARSG